MEENRIVSLSTKRKSLALSSEEPAAEATRDSRSESEKEVDEQMERFYALLENIKAMRHSWVGGGGGAGAGAGAGASHKKMKVDDRRTTTSADQVPWRPTFRLEDFMQGEASNCKATEHRVNKEDSGSGAERSDES